MLPETIRGVPDFVDRILVVDDASTDATVARARGVDPRVEVIQRARNGGVGAAVVTGYRHAIAESIDVTCVMNGDAQMDPADLISLVAAVARGECDYAKANRVCTPDAKRVIPSSRYVGIIVLSFLTKVASGYWKIGDSQSGYTAVNLETLRELDLDGLYPRYGFPNDMLVHLNVGDRRVREFPSRPIYGIGEESGMRLPKVIPTLLWLLVSGFWWRLKEKYLVRDFHPLVVFYAIGTLLLAAGFVLGAAETGVRMAGSQILSPAIVVVALLVAGLWMTVLAMWLDQESNKGLSGRGRSTAPEQATVSRV